MLEGKQLIVTEQTIVQRHDGRRQNGNLLYTIRPIHEAVEYFHERQMAELERNTAIHNAKLLAAKRGVEFHPADTGQTA